MLVQRDTVAEERFIATGFVLLVNLLVLEQLDLSLHDGDLTLEVVDDVLFKFIVSSCLVLGSNSALLAGCGTFQI